MEEGQGKFLGEIEPRSGRWQWPFRDMQEGDWFLVSWEQRDPESVRNLAAVKGSQFGKGMRIEKRPAEYPGFTRVTCTELGAYRAKHAPKPSQTLDAGRLSDILLKHYGVTAEDINFWHTQDHVGKSFWWAGERSGEAVHDRVVYKADWASWGFQFLSNGILIHPLPQGISFEGWKFDELADIMG